MFLKCSKSLSGPILTLIAVLIGLSPAAIAHPLGNYSINQYTIFDLRGDGISIHYMLDIAEIPTFREMDLLDTNMDNEISEDEISVYMAKRVPEFVGNLSLTLDGAPLPLQLRGHRLEVYSGSAEMPIFNIFLELEVADWAWPATAETLAFDYRSKNSQNARGYREANVLVDGRYEVSVGPWNDDELKYQSLVLKDDQENPLFQSFYNRFRIELSPGSGVTLAALPPEPDFTWTATARSAEEEYTLLAKGGKTFEPGEASEAMRVAAAESADAVEAVAPPQPKITRVRPSRTPEPTNSKTAENMLSRVSNIISTKELTAPMIAIALGIALMLGMGHAFSPGHGKTVMAAYLIGERGTVKHAIALGIIVTITHVWSVLLLGMVTLYAGERFTEEQVTFWTGVASGLIIVVIGVLLFIQRYSAYVLARHNSGRTPDHSEHHHDHDHSHDHAHSHDHSHDHEHTHDHDHEHTHVHKHGLFGKSHSHVIETDDGAPPTYSSIIWLGISGGIVPCPAALIVLLLAIKFGRLQLGLFLITAFSIGLAAVLVAIGIAVVKASGEVRKRIGGRSPILLALPVVSSVLITILGLWLILWTLIQFNVIIITPIA